MTLNPDLTFKPFSAVGDVKYRLTSDWGRSDIYQATTFATGYRVRQAAVVSFRASDVQRFPDVMVGDVRLVDLPWMLTEGMTPSMSEALLLMSANTWLTEMSTIVVAAS